MEWAETDLSHVSGRLLTEEGTKFLLEFLPYALEDSKRVDTVERACKYDFLAAICICHQGLTSYQIIAGCLF